MFTDKQLAWFALALAAITLGVISISSPVHPQRVNNITAAPKIVPLPSKVVPIPPPAPKADLQPTNNRPHNPNDMGYLAPAPRPPQTQYPILPPPEYDKPYDGDLTIIMLPTFEALRAACNVYNPKMLACARHNAKSCVIYLVEDEVMRTRGWNTGLLLRHEIGHCNGWPGDHPDQRNVPWPLTHWVPASERVGR
jgi:hypothetical protein